MKHKIMISLDLASVYGIVSSKGVCHSGHKECPGPSKIRCSYYNPNFPTHAVHAMRVALVQEFEAHRTVNVNICWRMVLAGHEVGCSL